MLLPKPTGYVGSLQNLILCSVLLLEGMAEQESRACPACGTNLVRIDLCDLLVM